MIQNEDKFIKQCMNISRGSEFLSPLIRNIYIKEAIDNNLIRYELDNGGDVKSFLVLREYKKKYAPGTINLYASGVAKEHRNRGLYTSLLRNAIKEFHDRILIGEVREDNDIPNQVLPKLGFKLFDTKFVGKNKDIKILIYMLDQRKDK